MRGASPSAKLGGRNCWSLLGGLLGFLLLAVAGVAQPVNDNCTNAINIPIPNAGYGFGFFVGDTVNLTGATLQFGEYIPPQHIITNNKSVWYRFSIATTREVSITIYQPGVAGMSANSVGWTLYRTTTCLPGAAQVVDPPILNIEGYTHKCLQAGTYYVQVSALSSANDSIAISLDVKPSSANEIQYDYAAAPLDFGVISGINLPPFMNRLYDVGCQSHFPGEPLCPSGQYGQTTWHVFRTDAHVDHVRFEVGEDPWNTANTLARTWGYRLYQGDCRLDSLADGLPAGGENLADVSGCQTLTQTSSGAYGAIFHNCQLQPNTTYSIQLMHPVNYSNRIRVRMYEVGAGVTQGANPNALPPSNQLGTVNASGTLIGSDVFSCNARMALYAPCGTAIPPSGQHTHLGTTYELNTWFTFTVGVAGHVTFNIDGGWAPTVYTRIYQGDVATAGCGGISFLRDFRTGSYTFHCMEAGTYSIQLLGLLNPPDAHYYNTHLGRTVTLSITQNLVSLGDFGLHTAAEIDQINGGAALASGGTYTATRDTIDCRTTYLPAGDVCGALNDRAIFRRIVVSQDGILTISGGNWWRFAYRLYRGDASTAPVVAGRLQGLVDQAGCQSTYYPFKVCVTPGVYTLVSFGDSTDIGQWDQPTIRFQSFGPTAYTNPAAPEVMGTLSLATPSLTANPSRIYCTDNPLTILGYAPCNGATKQVYREVYLDDDYLVTFGHNHTPYMVNNGGITHRVFRGRISDGSINALHRNCFGSFTECMPPGWYTIVTYAQGKTFTDPIYGSGLGDNIGDLTGFTLSINTNVQKFGGLLSDADDQYHLTPIAWGPNVGHTAQVPHQHRTFTLQSEFWDCGHNLPFPAGIVPCVASQNRVSYRVFTLTKPSYVVINGVGAYSNRIYQGDIRSLAPPFAVVQECVTGTIRICNLPAGTYTLATFAGDAHIGQTFTPSIYIDSVGVSKYDHAAAAYNFTNIPNNNTEYFAAPGAPTDALGRPASNDFFFCTTTAQPTDPSGSCYVYNTPRQTLWYTFELTGPGAVHVSVYNLTLGKSSRSPFAIYRATDTPTFPPADSTLAQGLQFVATSSSWWCSNSQTVTFYRDPCNSGTDRYYIVVDNHTGNEPNQQIQVGIRFQPTTAFSVNYDHYSQASSITGNPSTVCQPPYPNDTLAAPGTYTGCMGSLPCATQDPTDQNTCGSRTLWYTFAVNASGRIRINYDRTAPGGTAFNDNDIQLYRQVVPGDSTSAGLVRVPLSTIYVNGNPQYNPASYYYWGQGCMQPGRYYILFTGCNYPNETVVPRVWLLPEDGDLCTDPGTIVIGGTGSFNDVLTVDCHTVGEGPGEDGTNMGCLGMPTNMKTQWVRVEISGVDTVDIDIELLENTSVTSSQIRFRVGYGDCNSMTFENCVAEGTFIVLNMKCRLPGTYWIQSILPQNATGTITYNVTVTPTSFVECEPIDPNAPTALFNFAASCVDEPVTFINQSTTGDSISYFWDFGNGLTSTDFNPIVQYVFPDTYYVTLIVTAIYGPDTLADTLVREVIVNGVPGAFINPPGVVVAGQPFTLTSGSSGTLPSSIYYWNLCAGGPCEASPTTYIGPNPPPLTFTQAGVHTVCLTVYNGSCDSTYCLDIPVTFTNLFTGGPYDGHSAAAAFANCFENIFTGGPYDGHGSVVQYAVCSNNIFAGGPYDGHGSAAVFQNCMTNIYAGGPYDGHGTVMAAASCVVNIFAGGPYDGHGSVAVFQNCITNIFAGGPYDGHGWAQDNVPCPIVTTMWSGGPYDGHGSAYESACIVPPNFFVGGPFDGHGTAAQFGTCVQNIYAGGPYDGHAAVAQYATCELSIYAGGPYDGHGVVAQYATCVLSIFAGGPYDGHSSATLLAACSNNIFTGGPYDGHGAASRFGNCFQNIFVGGPYDGHGAQFLPCNLPNIFAGGPYDGFGVAIRLAVGAIGDTVCPGNPATLTANSPVDWYDVPTGGTPLAVGATTFVTPPLANTRIYYISGGCGGTPKTGSIHGRTQVIAHVLGYISPAATSVPACAGFPTQFYNQTTVSGAPVASLNPTGHITSLGTTGTPPSPGQLTFSSASGGTPNYTRLRDGVHDGSGAWTGGNTAVSDVTHWIQLNYVSPRSINRFYYWNDPNINYRFHAPRQIRLYYQGATGWVLVKVFNPPYPSNSTYDTGPIGETNGLFANRWKMEVDVDTTYAPRWGEFQVFASGPTIGGTLNWDFGDGNTSTAQNPAHVYTTPGTYTVTLSASAPECCSNPISFPVEVCEVLPLAVEQNHLVGWFRPESQDIQLQWDVVGTFATAAFQKWVGNQWVTLDSQAYTPANRYYALDAAPTYNANNLYRVRYYDADGNHGLSNSVNIRPGLPTAEYARIYPNPVDGTEFNLDLSLLQPTEVYLRIVDMAGREVKRIYLGNQPAGDTRHLVPAQGLSAGVYAVEVQAGSLTHRERILFLRP